MRIGTYTRISTDEEHQPFSLESQAERLGAYVRSQEGWELTRQFTDQSAQKLEAELQARYAPVASRRKVDAQVRK